MNKKLSILVAALIATTSIVATSANAAPMTNTVAGVVNTTTSTAPKTVAVPTSNVLDNSNTVALTATADTGTVVTFAGSGVKLVSALNTVDAPKNVNSGTSSISVTSQGVAITVYAYTTSTSVGSVTITNGAYSTIVYVQGIAGVAANISVAVPSAAAVNTAPTFTVSATDVFGNAVASEAISVTLIGASFSDGSITKSLTTSAVTSAPGVTPVTVLGSATGTLSAVSAGTVTVVATDTAIAATAVGLPAAVRSAIATFNVSDLGAQVTALTAQLAVANKALADEKSGRAADKVVADKALADEKAGRAADKVVADKALADEKAGRAADKVVADKALADANAKYAALVKLYNSKAKKYKFTATK